jgi:DNA-binding PadR family transcriptional regulator
LHKTGNARGKNEIDLMVLGVLTREPAHGYEVKKRIARSFGTQYPNISDSAIYPRLAQFEKVGLVESRIELQQQQGERSKNVYRLTEAVFKRVRELVATPVLVNGPVTDAKTDWPWRSRCWPGSPSGPGRLLPRRFRPMRTDKFLGHTSRRAGNSGPLTVHKQ